MLQKPTELGQGLGKGTTPLCRGLCSLFLSQPTFCSASAVPRLPGDRLEFVGDTWSVCRGQDGPQAGRALCGATRLSFVSALLLLSPPLLSPCSLLYTPLPCHTGPSRASSELHSGPAVVRGWRLGTGGGKAVAWVAAAECHEALLGAAGSGGRSQMSAP